MSFNELAWGREKVGKEVKSSEKVLRLLGQREPRGLEMQEEVKSWNRANSKEEYTFPGWAWYRDSEEAILIRADNHTNLTISSLVSSRLMIRNKLMLHRIYFLDDEEGYEAIRENCEGRELVGPSFGWGIRKIPEIPF